MKVIEWEITDIHLLLKEKVDNLLNDGWEPFSVADNVLYLKRQKN